MEEPLDGHLPRGGGGRRAGGEHVEKPLLPLLPDPLQLPEPLLQQGDGGEHHLAFAALHPHDDWARGGALTPAPSFSYVFVCVYLTQASVYFARCVWGFCLLLEGVVVLGMCVFISRKVLSRRRASSCGRLASCANSFIFIFHYVMLCLFVCFVYGLIEKQKRHYWYERESGRRMSRRPRKEVGGVQVRE